MTVSQAQPRHKGFRRWFEAGFGSELLPIIPPDAKLAHGSTVRPEHRGKTPGKRNNDGTWSGFGGKWGDEFRATAADAKRWIADGASVGLQSRRFLGLDIDVEHDKAAARIERLAQELFGLAPIRERDGSPRRLLVYRAPEGSVIRKRRLTWLDAAGAKQAVELLGQGQQFVVEGPHPKGGAYVWRHGESPCEWTPAGLVEIDSEAIETFFARLGDIVTRNGGTLSTGSGAAATGILGPRKGLDDPALWASGPEMVLAALKAWPNTADNIPTHDDFVAALAAVKAALGPSREDHYAAVEEWALEYEGNDSAYVHKTWHSITDASLGAEWLFQTAKAGGFDGDAQDDFADVDDAQAKIGQTPLDRLLDRFVWCQNLERYIDLKTGDTLTSRQFNAKNVHIAQYGRSGVQSAEATFQNTQGARKATVATYRPGQPPLIEENNERGVPVRAVNMWRGSQLRPIANADASTIAPWLDHVTEIFGEPGDASREHFLDWCGFALQHPGHKINHALVVIGGQGIGKDTAFLPVFQAVGMHNVASVKTEELHGQWTWFLERTIVHVTEMMNFTRREIYNKMKDWIAAPPLFVPVNKKHLQQYMIPNIQLWVIFSNEDDAIALDPDDRRFWVHRAYLDEKKGQEYYGKIYDWFANERGFEKVYGWLLARDVSRFDPAAAPPVTAAKEQMIEAAQPAAVKWLHKAFAEDGTFASRDYVAARELVTYARNADDAPGEVATKVQEKHAISALRAAGYHTAPFKVKVDGMPLRLWTRKRGAELEKIGHGRVATDYAREAEHTAGKIKAGNW